MTLTRPMSITERAALADAIRDMRHTGIRPRDLVASGAPGAPVRKASASLLRLAPKAVRP